MKTQSTPSVPSRRPGPCGGRVEAAGIEARRLPDVPDRDRSAGLPHQGQDAPIVRRQHGIGNLRAAMRHQQHRRTGTYPGCAVGAEDSA